VFNSLKSEQTNVNLEELKSKITGWLTTAGFIVAPYQGPLPSNAACGLLVTTPPPLQVKVRIVCLNDGNLITGIAINISDYHRKAIEEMNEKERIKLTSQMIRDVLRICPYCRLGIQGPLHLPTAIIAEAYLDSKSLTMQRLVDDVTRLVNIFLVINSILWEYVPPKLSEEGLGTQFM
jgi:hypothetical protein